MVDDVIVDLPPTAMEGAGVSKVRVIRRQVSMQMLHVGEIVGRPDRHGAYGGGQRDAAENNGCDRQARSCGEPAGEGIGHQPAAGGQEDLGGEGGGKAGVRG
ncbi:hypothetical protein [Nonomuraea dietziae]|uniref:hypothetical protein n=1 Tax=Nonomuraea dietziae TaxID=65515 RepID=UPI0033F72E12